MEGFIADTLYDQSVIKRNKSLINRKMIFRVLGILLWVETTMFLLCAGVSWYYNEGDIIRTFLQCAGINTLVGGLFILLSRGAERKMNKRDGYCIASLTWVLFTLFGMLPFYFSGSVDSITNAFFETMSGFTTTGATIMDNIDSQPHGILFWRNLTNLIGGLGIVSFALVILPIFNEGNLQLFSAEATGVTQSKLHPKVSIMVKQIWGVYLTLNLLVAILLRIGGMNWFDAVCHSFATLATGGYSTKQASIAYWNSPFIEYVIALFMVIGSLNFSLIFLAAKGKISKIWHDEETRWFLWSVIILTAACAIALMIYNGYGAEEAFRKSLFQITTIHSSCGLSTEDYSSWPPFTWVLLLFAMLAGGCTGSTAGGIKATRLQMMAKGIRSIFRRLLHPNAVLPVRINRQTIASNVVLAVAFFVILYMVLILIGWLALMILGVGFMDSLGVVASSIGNTGLAFGNYSPSYSWNALPDAGKWILSFLMLVGRLEMYCVLLLFYPSFWKNR